MVRWLLSDTKWSTWNFDFLGSGPGGRRFKSSLPDQFFKHLQIARWVQLGATRNRVATV